MTFNEAKTLIDSLPSRKVSKDGTIMDILITPKNKDEFNNFVASLLQLFRGVITDESAKEYSLSNEYEVYAIRIVGSTIIHQIIQVDSSDYNKLVFLNS